MTKFNNISVNDINDNNGADFYEGFRRKLMDIEQFPSIYTFKFIVPAGENKSEDIAQIFAHPSTQISSKNSKTGKYNSLTVKTYVTTADEVIDYYKKVSLIEKVIML